MASRRIVAEAGPNLGSGSRTSSRMDESTAFRTLHRARAAKFIQKIVGSAVRVQNSVDLLDRMLSGAPLPKQRTFLCHLKRNHRTRVQAELAAYFNRNCNLSLRRNHTFHRSRLALTPKVKGPTCERAELLGRNYLP